MAAAQVLVGLTTLTNAEADGNFSRIGDTGVVVQHLLV